AVMSDALWRSRFGADASILGKALQIDGQTVTIVGIMPPRFVWWGARLWFPLALDTSETDRGARRITVQGRVKPGTTPGAAAAALDLIGRRWEHGWSSNYPEYRGIAFQPKTLVDDVLRGVPETLGFLFGAVALVLLVASANLGNLLLARASAWRGELAVRV